MTKAQEEQLYNWLVKQKSYWEKEWDDAEVKNNISAAAKAMGSYRVCNKVLCLLNKFHAVNDLKQH